MTRKKNKAKNKKIDVQELKQRAKDAFQRYSNHTMNYKQASKKMGVNNVEIRQEIPGILEELKMENFLKGAERGYYKLNYEPASVIGKVDMAAHGSAYII